MRAEAPIDAEVCAPAAVNHIIAGAARNGVVARIAIKMVVAGAAETLREGVEEAAEALDKGLANALLNCWIAYK